MDVNRDNDKPAVLCYPNCKIVFMLIGFTQQSVNLNIFQDDMTVGLCVLMLLLS